jgi:O-antigen/teichoic acid export membrane protein
VKKVQKIMQKLYLSPNHKRIINNVYWAVLGKSVNIISGLLVGIFVARYLGPAQYGLMSYVISYVTLFSILATFGLDNIEIRELSKNLTSKEEILGTAFLLKIILAAGTIFLILITLLIFESDSFTFWTVLIYSLSLIFSSLNVIKNYFTSIVKNEYIVKTEISRTIIGAGIKLFLLINELSLIWFIIANTFDFVLVGSGYIYSYHKKVGSIRKWIFDKTVARLLLKESFPLLLSGVAIVIYQRIDQVMIRNMIDTKAVGQFAIAAGITDFVIFIPNVIAQTITPLLVQTREQNIGIYNSKKQQFMDVMVWSSVLMALVISLSAHLVISFLYGAQYSEAIPVLQIMTWKAVFVALFIGSGQLIIIENIQKYAAVRNILGCVVSVLLNMILIPIWGIIGSAVATIVTISFSGYLSHLFIKPYRYLFRLQTSAMFTGWKRIAQFSASKLFQ